MSELLSDAVEYYRGLRGCCLSESAEPVLDAAVEVLHFEPSEQEGSGAGVLRLSDDRYAVFVEWQDYTGHG